MPNSLPAQHTKRAADFLSKVRPRGRLIFIIDATGSREETWETATQLQAEMFVEAAKTGSLEIQIVYFRGPLSECKASHWTQNAHELARIMGRVSCQYGETQIAKALRHAGREHAHQEIAAVVYVGDMCEEPANKLYDAAAGLPPVFLFQEGDDGYAAEIFKHIAELTKGAYANFDHGAANRLSELLRAVAAFSVGGAAALTDQQRKLVGWKK
jgi:hypothetical protein